RSGKSDGAASTLGLLVRQATLSGGRVIVANTSDRRQRIYDDVTVEVKDLSYTAPFTFTGSAKTPNGGRADIDGRAGPVNVKDATATPFQANLRISDLNLASTGLVDP